MPVDDAHAMHIVEGRGNLSHVMHGPLSAEATFILQVIKELAAGAIVQHKVEFILCLLRKESETEAVIKHEREIDDVESMILRQ